MNSPKRYTIACAVVDKVTHSYKTNNIYYTLNEDKKTPGDGDAEMSRKSDNERGTLYLPLFENHIEAQCVARILSKQFKKKTNKKNQIRFWITKFDKPIAKIKIPRNASPAFIHKIGEFNVPFYKFKYKNPSTYAQPVNSGQMWHIHYEVYTA